MYRVYDVVARSFSGHYSFVIYAPLSVLLTRSQNRHCFGILNKEIDR